MKLEQFLDAKGIDYSALLDTLRQELELQAEESLYLVGSIAEGLGNLASDLDFMLLIEDVQTRVLNAGTKAIVIDNVICDVEFVGRVHLATVEQSVYAWRQQNSSLSYAKILTDRDIRLLHRIYNGRLLAGREEREPTEPRKQRFADFRLARAQYEAYALLVDIPGFLAEKSWTTLELVCHELLGHSCDAILAVNGRTNPTTKWRLRQIASIEDDGLQSLINRSVTEVESLYRSCSSNDETGILERLRAVVAFVRLVFLRATVLGGEYNEALLPLPKVSGTGFGSVGSLDFDMAFLRLNNKVQLVRLNREYPRVTVSESQAILLCQIDGTKSAAELRKVAAHLSEHGEVVDVDECLAMLNAHKMFEEVKVDEQALSQLLNCSETDR